MTVQGSIIFIIAVVAACMDLVSMKIANKWIYLSWVAGLGYQIGCHGYKGIPLFLVGAVIPLLALAVLFLFRMLGPGDIKLFSALGGIMTTGAIWKCMALSFLFGAVLSMGFLIICGNIKSRLRYFTAYITKTIQTGQITSYYRPGNQPENIHFSIPILMSAMLFAGGFY